MKLLLLAAFVASVSASCSVLWPNGTDTQLNWWPCVDVKTPITIYNVTTFDTNGNFEYPFHLGAPIVVDVLLNNPTNTYTQPNLRGTIKIWMWNRSTCSWTTIPTLGLLNNLDACAQGVPCPIKPGTQWIPATINFTPYAAIISELQDDMPYQLEIIGIDKKSGDQLCVMAQGRAYKN